MDQEERREGRERQVQRLAVAVGGFWLVPLALSPLRRLSEAVSRVSTRDFRLQFDEPHLPRELNPIVDRLTQTLDMLQRAFAREKQAAADISHELRTPLAALLTTTEVALRKPDASEPLSALAFKTVAESTGDLVYIRVYSGEMKPGETYQNTTTVTK